MTPGLREAKKAETRRALALALLRRASDGGLDSAMIDDVCADVGVSVRTFHNYFPDKKAAVSDLIVETMTRVIDSAAESKADTVWEALENGLARVIESAWTSPTELTALFRIATSDPVLHSDECAGGPDGAVGDRFADLAAQYHFDPQSLFGRSVLELALTVSRVALEYWNELPAPRPSIADTLADAFDLPLRGFRTTTTTETQE
ncbi:TetR/AcrR family transcriptional regulator [Gordonia sp. NPDC003376]